MSAVKLNSEPLKLTTKYGKGEQCNVWLTHYTPSGRLALFIKDAETSDPIHTATVNLVNEACPLGEVFVKDYSENAGMTQFLTRNHILSEKQQDKVRTGFVSVARHKFHTNVQPLVEEYIREYKLK